MNYGMSSMLFRDVSILDNLSSSDLDTFYSICKRRHYKKDDYIFHIGDNASTLYIVLEGQVKVVSLNASGKESILTIAGPRDFIGVAFLNENEVYRANAVARNEVLICPVMRDQFLELSVRVPAFVVNYSKLLTNQLFECRSKFRLTSAPIKARVAQVLLEQAQMYGSLYKSDCIKLSTQLTHDELAAMVSATRSSVSLAIGELRREKAIEGTRGHYTLYLSQLLPIVEVY